jgi:hypothetical protein
MVFTDDGSRVLRIEYSADSMILTPRPFSGVGFWEMQEELNRHDAKNAKIMRRGWGIVRAGGALIGVTRP